MSTSWELIYERFFKKIEKDNSFFSYYNVSDQEAIELATMRAKDYLIESISKLTSSCAPDIDFNDYDEEQALFAEDLTRNEVDLLASLMREKYFEKDMSLLKAFETKFSPKDLTVFSPANERKTFKDMLDGVIDTNNSLIREYMSRDRLTGKLKGIDFSKYQV